MVLYFPLNLIIWLFFVLSEGHVFWNFSHLNSRCEGIIVCSFSHLCITSTWTVWHRCIIDVLPGNWLKEVLSRDQISSGRFWFQLRRISSAKLIDLRSNEATTFSERKIFRICVFTEWMMIYLENDRVFVECPLLGLAPELRICLKMSSLMGLLIFVCWEENCLETRYLWTMLGTPPPWLDSEFMCGIWASVVLYYAKRSDVSYVMEECDASATRH